MDMVSCRKVIEYSYNGCGDTGDQAGGHGTHVSGTVLGSMINADIENGEKQLTCEFESSLVANV